ncbi:MAG: hypothetical protein IT169_12455 [Bryobacterales bacterium]|nr:hypothetical protein [Bryobacterales bacterium]
MRARFGLFVFFVFEGGERGGVGGDGLGEPVGFALAREEGFRGAVAKGGGKRFVALDGVEEHAGVGVGGVEAAKDIAAVGFAGGFDGGAKLRAIPPFFVAGAADADIDAGVRDRFALGEVAEEIHLTLLAGAFVGSLLEGEWFRVGGLHEFCFLSLVRGG